MIIKIDCRESDLLNKLKSLPSKDNITILSESLPLGDIIICDNEGNELVIIERKTLKDLAASIRDGRYKEQSFRLNECSVHNHNIIYLIEGDIRTYKPFKGSIDKNALLSSFVSITYYKGFSLYKTNSIEESSEWILQYAFKLHKESVDKASISKTSISKTAFYSTTIPSIISEASSKASIISEPSINSEAMPSINSEAIPSSEAIPYSLAMKRTKKNNITPNNIGEIMLSQIPNVSTEVAIVIMNKFKTIKNLVEALSTDRTILNEVTTINKNGQKRRINKTTIENIYTFLLYNGI